MTQLLSSVGCDAFFTSVYAISLLGLVVGSGGRGRGGGGGNQEKGWVGSERSRGGREGAREGSLATPAGPTTRPTFLSSMHANLSTCTVQTPKC